jgi:pyruvate/2-oxoglutarate dehydrogenase complex dihydrolipoamide acyltransferase (E2) component
LATEITMPQMGVSVVEGTIVEWKKEVGDWIEADEVIASISTDKIDTDVEAPAAGRLEEILVAVGETVEVGTILALIATDAKPGEAHSSEGTRRPATPASCRATAPRSTPTAPRRRAPRGGPVGGATRPS